MVVVDSKKVCNNLRHIWIAKHEGKPPHLPNENVTVPNIVEVQNDSSIESLVVLLKIIIYSK